ncbi:IS256 family transposase [Clostridium thermosuccinogenes]|uniref:Mutator family transposase n=1 Tax=Clostridium thermosuccinogenes TaxID=84032 RepID=A0A2K2EYZ0_9CLOT|nr:IS256 family transposase [Pseudoclostridium thermosuccinogenes]PNT90723.1 IS256 family transposase [Pseudoclostridium thermosuccinogenes]PNT91763.1 IS256 family transposase [Pseudoclostridium thermosuccinogenes]
MFPLKQEDYFSDELLDQLIKEYNIKDTDDIKNMLKDLMGSTIQRMLNSELDEELDYEKYDVQNKETDNSRNGYSKKTVRSEYGEIELDIPRDRNGEFEPQIVKKNQTEIKGIEGQIISMYAKGMSNRDIETHLQELYGIEVSPTLISRITDKILPEIKEWQSRMLKSVYPIVFMDAIHYSVRKDGIVVKKAVYIAIGIDLESQKDILGMWIGEAESSKFWLSIMNEIKNRGVRDILITSVDGLNGFSEVIRAVFPMTEIQRCIVHQIRNSTKFISYKDLRSFTADLKPIYKAATEALALQELDAFESKWGSKYPNAVRSWRNNWEELSVFFKYPREIRKIIYTTNAIENFNRQLRKVTKTKSAYPSDDALIKALYLAVRDITKK